MLSIPIVSSFDNKGIRGAVKEFKQLETTGQKAGFALKKAMIPATAALGALGGAALSAIKSASDLGESVNAVKVTFGQASAEILKLSDAAAESVGLSKKEFNTLAVRFSSFATKIAGKGGNVAKTLEKLTGRAADFASVMNIDVSEAAAKFQSGLAGEAEPLKQFGIDLSDVSIKAFAAANNIGTLGKKGVTLTEAEKVLARYGALMEQTEKFSGDFKNTSDGLANSQRILQKKFENVKAEIGTGLLPVMEEVLPYLQEFADWAIKNPDAFKTIAISIGAIAAATVAVNAAMAVNPYVLITGSVIALAIAFERLFQALENISKVGGIAARFAGAIIGLPGAAGNLVGKGLTAVTGGNQTPMGRLPGGTNIAPSMAPSIATTGNRGVIVNVNTGVGDPAAIGREVQRLLDFNNRRTGNR